MKLDINNKRNAEKSTNTWKLNKILLGNHVVKKEVKKYFKNPLKTNEN